MMHGKRRWCLATVPTPEALAQKLTGHTWTLCTAFSVEGHPDYLFLNDATSEDGAAEFGVVKRAEGGHVQVKSVTFSWCSAGRALELIRQALAGEFDAQAGRILQLLVETSEEHRDCPLCA